MNSHPAHPPNLCIQHIRRPMHPAHASAPPWHQRRRAGRPPRRCWRAAGHSESGGGAAALGRRRCARVRIPPGLTAPQPEGRSQLAEDTRGSPRLPPAGSPPAAPPRALHLERHRAGRGRRARRVAGGVAERKPQRRQRLAQQQRPGLRNSAALALPRGWVRWLVGSGARGLRTGQHMSRENLP
jgi:hypothetical protein